jgi:hypothetical protein
MDFFAEYRRQLDDPARSPFGEYAEALEELCTRMSSMAGACLRTLHSSDYPFEIALRPYYYMAALQYANVKHYPPPRDGDAVGLVPFNRLDEMFESTRDDPLHRILHPIVDAGRPRGAVEQLLDDTPAGAIGRSAAGSTRKASQPSSPLRLGLSLSLIGLEEAVLSLRGRGKIRLIRPRPSPGYGLDPDLRKRFLRGLSERAAALPPDSDAAGLLLASAAALPTYYLEGFADQLAAASALADSLVGLVGGTDYHRHPQVALLVPLLRARGRVTVGTQHGAVYGQTDPSWHERAERALFERYLTWGYRHRPEDVPMAAIRMSRQRVGHVMQRTRRELFGPATQATLVVLPCVHYALSYSIHSPSVNRQMESLRRTFEILAGSPAEAGPFVVRCHPRNRPEEYAEAVPESLRARVSFARGFRGSLARDAHRYAEVVFANPNATGLTECMANRVEFGIAADPSLCHIRPEARPVYDELIRARVWMTDPAARADYLARRAELAGLRREALARFAEQYALQGSGYLGQWSRFLSETYRTGLERVQGSAARNAPD